MVSNSLQILVDNHIGVVKKKKESFNELTTCPNL